MKTVVIADRKPELELFRDMLADKIDTRILLIRADGGRGKTNLLARLAHECADDLCVIRYDLKNAIKGTAQILGLFRDKLGVDALPRFHAALGDLDPNINITNNTTLGKLDISVFLNVDEQTKKMRLERLEAAFFDDLRAACSNIVVIFDTFDLAPEDLQKWLSGSLLHYATTIPQLRVVIGGRCVPAPTIEEWEEICARHELHEIQDVDAWHVFAQETHLPFSRDAVKAFVMMGQGIPDNVCKLFNTYAAEWGK
jgi:hypothetical protein